LVEKEEEVFQKMIKEQQQKDEELRKQIETELKKEEDMRRQLDESKWQKEEQQRLVEEEIRRRLEDKEKEVKRKKKELEDKKKKHEMEKKKAEAKLEKLRIEKERLEKEENEKQDFQKSLTIATTNHIITSTVLLPNPDKEEEQSTEIEIATKSTNSNTKLKSNQQKKKSYSSSLLAPSLLEKVDLSSGLIVSSPRKTAQQKTQEDNQTNQSMEQNISISVENKIVDEFDLLGGGDVNETEITPYDNVNETEKNQNENVSEVGSNVSQSSLFHRDKPERGRIDSIADQMLDSLNTKEVPIIKTGRIDGVYLFGARVLKLDLAENKIFVKNGNGLGLKDFIEKHYRTEKLRLRALKSLPANLLM